jgi:predicted amino acid racemase
MKERTSRKMSKLPRIIVDPTKLLRNYQTIRRHCARAGVDLTMAVKGLAGDKTLIEFLIDAGLDDLGDSRLENLKGFQRYSGLKKMHLRLPSLSLVKDTVRFADISLNSEWATLEALDFYAGQQSRRHGVMLMVDLGDLREGVSESALPELAGKCRDLHHLEVAGLGVNFSCFAGVMPTPELLTKLVKLASRLREEFHLPIRQVSGGNSSSLPLLYENALPAGVNHLRIGEGILLGRETLTGNRLPDLSPDVFLVEAEVIQVQWKPAKPAGEVGRDAFGRIPLFLELEPGIRLLLNLGEQDTPLTGLTPRESGLTVLGGSSDYMVVASDRQLKVGQTVRFAPNYWSMLSLMSSGYVTKEYREF